MQNQVQLLLLLLSIVAAVACVGLAIYLAVLALPGFVRLSSIPGVAIMIGLVCSLVGAWIAVSTGRERSRAAQLNR
jgi:hypothetical protein